jgi:GMP synthase (glutamine-hydrolysing)
MENLEKIIILDFGSQYTQLIARKVREAGVYCEIYPYNITQEELDSHQPKGIILSGSPSSVYEKGSPQPKIDIMKQKVPMLGMCYGYQLFAYYGGGKVDKTAKREYGRANLIIRDKNDLFYGINDGSQVWMSHGDAINEVPKGFEVIGKTESTPYCAIRNPKIKYYGVQFHPEVHHSTEGKKMLENFVRNICGCKFIWNAHSFIETAINIIKEKVGNEEVLLALSGGVDSTVAAVLLNEAIGEKLHCVHIDSGLMRTNESQTIYDLFTKAFNIPVEIVNGSETFLGRLDGVSDPEQKRKIIGKAFIDLFEEAAKKHPEVKWLAQGTLYPDVIESVSVKGPSSTIKSHHNVGGLPEKMGLKLLEPFRELFKDEVREVGKELGVPEWFVGRHPFPGPGLAIRILGEISEDRINIIRQADDIYLEEIRNAGLYDDIWQAFAVLLPVKSVGVMGDDRTYEYTCALRAVTSVDGMTADWFPMPYDVLSRMSSRIINEVRGINRVTYDITSKPPGTIEWE